MLNTHVEILWMSAGWDFFRVICFKVIKLSVEIILNSFCTWNNDVSWTKR